MSDQGRKNISEARIGIIFTDKHKENMRLAHLGKKHPCSSETRKKISESVKKFLKNNK